MMWYKLEGKNPIPCSNIEASNFMQSAERIVDYTEINDIKVSTVFLCLDHGFEPEHEFSPVLFETMVFGGDFNDYMRRYTTWDDAKAGHRDIVEIIEHSLDSYAVGMNESLETSKPKSKTNFGSNSRVLDI